MIISWICGQRWSYSGQGDAGLKTIIWSSAGFVCSVRLGDDQGDAGLKTMIWSAAGFVGSVRLGDDQGGCSTKNYDMISSWICFLLRKGSLPWMGLKIEDLRDFCCWTPAFVWEKKSYVGCDNSCLCALKHQRLRRRKNNSDSCIFLLFLKYLSFWFSVFLTWTVI